MSEESAEYHHNGPVPTHISQSIAIQTLACTIEAAHQNGALLFLAMQLDLILSKRHERNRLVTAAEWEVVIIQAAKAMVSRETHTQD